MTFDDEARRLASATRTETDALPIPDVDELRPMKRSRVRPGLVATACVVVVALVVGAFALDRGSDHSTPVKTIEHPGTWERVPASAGGFRAGDHVAAIVRGGPGFVAVGAHAEPPVSLQVLTGDASKVAAAAWVSADGRRWHRARTPPDAPGLSYLVATPRGFYAIGRFLGPGGMPTMVVHSDDGRAWQAVGSAPWNILGVAAGGPGIVAVGSDSTPPGHAVIWLSADGSTWTRAPGDESVFPRGTVMGIASRSGTLVAIGTDYMQPRSQGVASFVWTSTDGEHWTLHSNALAGGSPQTITASDTEFLIGGTTFKPTTGASSSTTTTTTPRTAATEPAPGCPNVASVDSTLGTAQPTTWTSTDGVTWRPRVSATSPLSAGRVVVATNGWWVTGGLADPAGFTPGSRDLGDAGTWVSGDGVTWTAGLTERLPPGRCGPFARIVRALAPTATGAVVAVDSWGLPVGPNVLPAPEIWLWTAPK